MNTLKKQIAVWEEPVMVHESLRKIASLVKVPEEMVGISQPFVPTHFIKNHASHDLTFSQVDPNRVLELDLLRWLILNREAFFPTVQAYLSEEHFFCSECRKLYVKLQSDESSDLLSLAADVEDQHLIDEILQKKVNRERADALFLETVQKILDRQWMQTREAIKMEIHSGKHSDEHVLELAKEFDTLKSQRPVAHLISR